MTTNSKYSLDCNGNISCSACGRWVHFERGGVIKHSSRCDFAGDDTYHAASADPAAIAVEAKREQAQSSFSTISADAKKGDISRHSEESIQKAVNAHAISMSDAMNRDY